jgi:SAM-dependent methyltransferase
MDTKVMAKILGPRFDAVSEDGGRALKELRLPPDAAILDVGTGNGNFAIYLASQGYQVLTGEPSTDRSHYAGKDWALNAKKVGVLDKIRFEAFDASKLPFESEAFDAVFFFGVLHHVSEHLRGDVLREALRVSKQNGAVVFFEPRMEMLQRLWADDPGHPLAANPSDFYPTRASVHIELKVRSWTSPFTRKPWAFSPRGSRTLPIDNGISAEDSTAL